MWYVDEYFPWRFCIREAPVNATWYEQKNGKVVFDLLIRGVEASKYVNAVCEAHNRSCL